MNNSKTKTKTKTKSGTKGQPRKANPSKSQKVVPSAKRTTARRTAGRTTGRATRRQAPSLPNDVIAVLLEVARNARKNAYVPYSGYRVGSALLSVHGNVFAGCNVENASYGLAICSERTAIVKAISEGEREFVAIAVVTEDGGTPCGACRQFMAEFGLDTVVILADKKGNYTLHTVGSLLPNAFTLS